MKLSEIFKSYFKEKAIVFLFKLFIVDPKNKNKNIHNWFAMKTKFCFAKYSFYLHLNWEARYDYVQRTDRKSVV